MNGPNKLECLSLASLHSSLSGLFLSFKENEVPRFCEHESLSILGRDKVLVEFVFKAFKFFSKIVTFGMT
jgi:hypothetical protein